MLTGRTYRAVLTPEQDEFAGQVAAACRTVWNVALGQRREARQRWRDSRVSGLPFVGYAFQCRNVTEARGEYEWLRLAPVHVLQQTLKDLDRACREHGPFAVKFRAKARWAASMRFPDPAQIRVVRLNRRWAHVILPKIGPVRLRWSRPLGGELRNVTLHQVAGGWQVTFLVDTGQDAPALPAAATRPVGVDVGVAHAITDSTGAHHDRVFLTPGEQARIRRLQQTLARQRRTNPNWKASARRARTRTALATVFATATHRRSDFHHQTAATLTRTFDLIAVEDLSVGSMTRSAAGTLDAPGSNVAAKSGLNRAILDKGWAAFARTVLPWHAHKRGVHVRAVPAHHTSQTCPNCGHVARENRKSQAVFACVNCGTTGHADVIAAINIRERGILAPAPGQGDAGRGDLASRRSVKRQPPTRTAAPAA